MKTKRRHELATNELADWLGAKIELLKPYATAILATALAVAVGSAAYTYFSGRTASKQQVAWDRYLQALDTTMRSGEPDLLRDVAEQFPSAKAGLWARLSLANIQLSKGVDELYNDRAAANKLLDESIQSFLEVREQAPPNSLPAEQATFGLAQAYESKNKLEDARREYDKVVTDWPDGVLAAQAKQRLADLKRPAVKEFYDWFAKREPKPRPKPGDKPDFDLDSLDLDGDGATSTGSDLDRLLTPPPKAPESPESPDAAAPDAPDGTDFESSGDTPAGDAPADGPEEAAADDPASETGEAPSDELPGDQPAADQPTAGEQPAQKAPE